MIVKYYQLQAEDMLNEKPFEKGSLYFIEDTKRIFFDPIQGDSRYLIGGDPIIIDTEQDKDNILAPIPNKLYIVLESKTLYIYNNLWHKISGNNEDVGGSIIPPITEDDNGKFLRVVDGVPIWQYIPNAEDISV